MESCLALSASHAPRAPRPLRLSSPLHVTLGAVTPRRCRPGLAGGGERVDISDGSLQAQVPREEPGHECAEVHGRGWCSSDRGSNRRVVRGLRPGHRRRHAGSWRRGTVVVLKGQGVFALKTFASFRTVVLGAKLAPQQLAFAELCTRTETSSVCERGRLGS